MTINNPSVTGAADLLRLPLVDLLELPISAFGAVFRGDEVPSHAALAAFDQILLHYVARTLRRKADANSRRQEVDELRRLIPHARRALLDSGRKPWSARWDAFCDLLEIESEVAQADGEHPKTIAHQAEILSLLAHRHGCTQPELADILNLKPANLSRVLGLLEAEGLAQRELVGREKYVRVTHAGRLAVLNVTGEDKTSADLLAMSDSRNCREIDSIVPSAG
jgi:DNA-binding MarR family transcriptional regulator